MKKELIDHNWKRYQCEGCTCESPCVLFVPSSENIPPQSCAFIIENVLEDKSCWIEME